MALSDDLSKLAVRAKEAEDRTAAARDEAKADLERDISSVQASAQAQADKLRQTAQEGQGRISSRWTDVQRSWNEHVGKLREDMGSRKAEHDVHMAQVKADHAEEDARFAVDFAYSAVEEAEYAVLDATLARKEADELSQGAGATAAGTTS
jgi:hypothetical protein